MKHSPLCLTLLLLLVALPASHGLAQSAPIHHVVLLWFPPETSEQQIERVAEESRRLAAIPGVTNLKVGRAIESQRAIVDDSFDIGISMQFDSVDQMQDYLQHPKHQDFVKRFIKGKASKLLVYDF